MSKPIINIHLETDGIKHDGSNIVINTSEFSGNLDETIDDVNKLAKKFDEYSDASKAEYINGNDTFPSGTSYQVNNSFITENTAVTVSPLSQPNGKWVVDSYTGYFIIVSSSEESNIEFDWWAIK
jgi:hypothetical protein